MNQNVTNFHVEYMDVIQHWSPTSEKYAGADSLVTMLSSGWQMKEQVRRQEHWFAGMRCVNVYYFELERNGEKMTLPVIHNPYVNRMIMLHEIEVTPMEQKAQG